MHVHRVGLTRAAQREHCVTRRYQHGLVCIQIIQIRAVRLQTVQIMIRNAWVVTLADVGSLIGSSGLAD
jgi:hypothetical protein